MPVGWRLRALCGGEGSRGERKLSGRKEVRVWTPWIRFRIEDIY